MRIPDRSWLNFIARSTISKVRINSLYKGVRVGGIAMEGGLVYTRGKRKMKELTSCLLSKSKIVFFWEKKELFSLEVYFY